MKSIVTTIATASLFWVVASFMPGVALAGSPHFIDSKTKLVVEADGDLAISFKEAGLGDAETTYSANAIAAVTCTCVTNSGQCPKAANKVTDTSEASTTGSFDPKNGTVSATLTIPVPGCGSSAPPTCGGGQHLELSAISYTDISLTDVTNGVTATGLPSSVGPITFFTCPD